MTNAVPDFASPPSQGRSLSTVVLFALFAIATTTGLLAFAGWQSYRTVEAEAGARLASKAGLVEAQMEELVRGIASTLNQVLFEASRTGRCDQQQVERLARFYPEFRAVTVIDRQGINRCASLTELVGLDRSVETYVKQAIASPQRNVLSIEPPLVSKLDGVPVLVMHRAALAPDGRLQFIAQVSIDLRHFDRFLESLREANQSVSIFHESGTIVSQWPDAELVRFRNISSVASAVAAHRKSAVRQSTHRIAAEAGHVERFVAIAEVVSRAIPVKTGGKLLIGVSEATADAYAAWHRLAGLLALAWLLLVAMIVFLARRVTVAQRHLEGMIDQQRRTAEELGAVTSLLEQERRVLDEHAIVSIADARGTITYANDLFCDISGHAREELQGQNHRIVNSGTHPPEFFRDMWRTIAAGHPWHGLVCNKAKDGSQYWVRSTVAPIRDGEGRIDRYLSIRTDVTELVKAQEALRRSEQEFRAIFDQMQGLFFRSDRQGNVALASPAALTMLRCDPITLVGRPFSALFANAAQHERLLDALRRQGREVYGFVIEARRADGTLAWLSLNCRLLSGADGSEQGIEGVAHDVTQIHEMEQAVRAAKEEAERARDAAEVANRHKSTFLANMSHELRTPLNSIIGFSELMMTENLEADVRESVEYINKAGHRLLALIDEVLDLAKIEAGRIDLAIEAITVDDLLAEAVNATSSLARNKGIEVGVEKPAAGLGIAADRNRLYQVLLNLVSNAIKYNRPHGKVAIAAVASGDRVRISVSDTGIGMSPRDLERLFTPYTRLGPKNVEGTGIGLTITKSLVEAMGGEIGVSSEPGAGSIFWIELPGAAVLAPPAMQTPALQDAAQAAAAGTLLYIDDNPANLAVIAAAVRKMAGVRLLTADDPYEGLALALRETPDLVLLDINLPGIDGYEVLGQLRKDPRLRHVPIVALSAYAMPAEIAKGKAAGFDDYLTKPVNMPALREALRRHLQAWPATR